jgi:hypothetical protein
MRSAGKSRSVVGVRAMSREGERSGSGNKSVRLDVVDSQQSASAGIAHAPEPNDEAFGASMADLSRKLAARAATKPITFEAPPLSDFAPPPPGDEPRPPRVSPVWRLVKWSLFIVAVACGVYAFASSHNEKTSSSPGHPPAAAQTPRPTPPSSQQASAPAAPMPSVDPHDAMASTSTTAPPPASAASLDTHGTTNPTAASGPAQPPAAVPDDRPLETYEIMEIQSRLKALGFEPGPLDGVPGSRTLDAARRYETARGRTAHDGLDRALLADLRQDKAAPTTRTGSRNR